MSHGLNCLNHGLERLNDFTDYKSIESEKSEVAV